MHAREGLLFCSYYISVIILYTETGLFNHISEYIEERSNFDFIDVNKASAGSISRKGPYRRKSLLQ